MSNKPGSKDGSDVERGVAIAEKTKKKLEKPKLYKVLLHNDDYTTMEFVVAILREVFHHNEVDATRIMLHVHKNGMGVAGVYTFEVAETRVRKTLAMAKEAQYPLMCTMEPEE
jgi:ATP-dependent Clp protease adaptor protein ClpS